MIKYSNIPLMKFPASAKTNFLPLQLVFDHQIHSSINTKSFSQSFLNRYSLSICKSSSITTIPFTLTLAHRFSNFQFPKSGFPSLYENMLLYKNMLEGYKMSSMKKIQQNIKQAELNLISQILNIDPNQHDHHRQIFQYIGTLRFYQLFNVQTLDKIEKYVQANIEKVSNWDKLYGIAFLVEQNRYDLYQKYKNIIKNDFQANSNSIRGDLTEKLLIKKVLCNYWKNITSADSQKIQIDKQDINELFTQKTEKMISRKYPEWLKQYSYIYKIHCIQQQSLDTSPTKINTEGINKKMKNRSNLQIQVEALLTTLEYQIEREEKVYGFSVDFIIQKQAEKSNKQKQPSQHKFPRYIVQVIGSHHYTVQNKLFARDIIRLRIISTYLPVLLIHADQINGIKGLQNRLKYLEEEINAVEKGNRKQYNRLFQSAVH